MKRNHLPRSLVAFLAFAFAVVALPASALAQQPRRPVLRSAPTQVSKTSRPTMNKARPKVRIPPMRPGTPATTPAARPTFRFPAGRLPRLQMPWTTPGAGAPVIPATLPTLLPPTSNNTPYIIPAKLPPEILRHLPRIPQAR